MPRDICPTCGQAMRKATEFLKKKKPEPGMLGTGGAARAGKKLKSRQKVLEDALRKQGG